MSFRVREKLSSLSGGGLGDAEGLKGESFGSRSGGGGDVAFIHHCLRKMNQTW